MTGWSLELRLETNQNLKKWSSQINIFLIKYRCEILYTCTWNELYTYQYYMYDDTMMISTLCNLYLSFKYTHQMIFFFLKGGEGFGGFGVCLFFIFEEGYFFFQGG